MRFDASSWNPPYSIKQWDRNAFVSDPWGANLCGAPSQGRADYAFWQHILVSLAPKTGRCAILAPMAFFSARRRRKCGGNFEADLIDSFFASARTSSTTRHGGMHRDVPHGETQRAEKKDYLHQCRKGRPRTRPTSLLTDEHIGRIGYRDFKDEPGFAHVATLEEIRDKDGNLSIPLYVEGSSVTETTTGGTPCRRV